MSRLVDFISADIRSPEGRFEKYREVVDLLPEENRVLLNYLLHFLTLVAAQAAVNKVKSSTSFELEKSSC